MEYIAILLYEWSTYSDVIKEILHNNKMMWNSEKIKKLTTEELTNEFIKFKVDKDFKIDETTIGSSGIYENKSNDILIKIIKPESVDDTKKIDDVLIIYKGIKENFYIELMKKFRDIGCLILKIVDDEVIFKNRINVKLINSLNDIEREKDIKIKNFIEKSNVIGAFSEDFKQQWIKLITNH